MDSLNSQTKCNTSLRCCQGKEIQPVCRSEPPWFGLLALGPKIPAVAACLRPKSETLAVARAPPDEGCGTPPTVEAILAETAGGNPHDRENAPDVFGPRWLHARNSGDSAILQVTVSLRNA